MIKILNNEKLCNFAIRYSFIVMSICFVLMGVLGWKTYHKLADLERESAEIKNELVDLNETLSNWGIE